MQFPTVQLGQAETTLVGQAVNDRFGSLSNAPARDWDGDGIDDLMIGAAYADGSALDAGKVYLVPGQPFEVDGPTRDRRLSRPQPPADYQVLTNRTVSGSGNFLVDGGTGQPEVYTATLAAGQREQWYQFTTLGDGQVGNTIYVSSSARQPVSGTTAGKAGIDDDAFWPESDTSNTVMMAELYRADGSRVEPIRAAYLERAYYDPVDGWIGGTVENRKSLLDTRSLAAGTYYLRVYAWTWELQDGRPVGTEGHVGAVDYTLEIAAPKAGAAHPIGDRAWISGGDGDDRRLVGGPGVDLLRGQSGADVFVAEPAEIVDLAAYETRIDPPAEQQMSRPAKAWDAVVTAADFADDNLATQVLVAAAFNAGVPVTLSAVSYAGQALDCLWQVSADNGQTVPDGTGCQFSLMPADNGTYTVTLTASNDNGPSTDSMQVFVANVAPRIHPGSDAPDRVAPIIVRPAGPFGGALSLDGVDDYVEMASSLNNVSDWTFTAWMLPTAGSSGEIYSEGNPLSTLRIIAQSDGSLKVSSWNVGYAGNWMHFTTPANAIQLNRWNFIAVTLAGGDIGSGTLQVIVNGNTYTGSLQKQSHSGARYAALGQNVGSTRGGSQTSNLFTGQIDEVSIWTVARSETEIRDDMYRTWTGTEPGLVAYWPLDEGGGETVVDKAAGKHHGTLHHRPLTTVSTTPLGPAVPQYNFGA